MTEDYTHVVTQVVDALSGAPIPGAKLTLVEVNAREARTSPVPRASATADEFGFVRVPADPEYWGYAFVEAAGYAPNVEQGAPDFPVALSPGTDVRVRILDPLGRPANGTQAQYYFGGGSGPNARQPVADATGQVTFRSIDVREGLLFPIGEFVAGEDIDLGKIPAFDGVRTVHGQPGGTVVGRVLDLHGKPISGAPVGVTGWHHGPWTTTDREGNFRLVGVESHSEIRVYRSPIGDEVVADFEAPPRGTRVTVREGWKEERKGIARIRVQIPTAPKATIDKVELVAVRTSDGRTNAWTLQDAPDDFDIELPEGQWELRVGSGVDPCLPRVAQLEVIAGKTANVDVPLKLWPRTRIDIPDLEVGWGVVVSSTDAQRWLTDDEEESGLVRLPRDRALVVRVVTSSCSAAGYPGGFAKVSPGDVDGIRLAPPPNRTEWDTFPFFVQSDDAAESGSSVITVLGPDGNPLEGASVKRTHGNAIEMRYTDEEGQVSGGPTGAHVEVRTEDEHGYWAPLRMRLSGAGPWTMRYGKASVRIEVRDEEGNRCTWYGLFPDGDAAWEVDEDVSLFGMQPGFYRILACAPGKRGVIRQFRLEEGTTRRLQIVLPNE
ncbi:MAG: carboxypeptidase-like regulatory domain-containing protein [Planctomycetota bacterium]